MEGRKREYRAGRESGGKEGEEGRRDWRAEEVEGKRREWRLGGAEGKGSGSGG